MELNLIVIFKLNIILFILFLLAGLKINYSTMKSEKGALLHNHYKAKVFSNCLQIYALCFFYSFIGGK